MRNKKGFTLIELLAVIVILAILVMLAIPAVTRYLTTARKSAFSDNALRAVEAVRNDIVTAGFSTGTTNLSGTNNRSCDGQTCTYNKEAIDDLLENKFGTSSFGNKYTCLGIIVDREHNTYTMYMIDQGKNGFANKTADQINDSAVNIGTEETACPNGENNTPDFTVSES